MPKELTHLVLAEASCSRFFESALPSGLDTIIKEYKDYYLFGAVMHDLAFCASSTPEGEKVKDMGQVVHGKLPGDTMRPFRYLAEEFDKTGKPEILAMIAGAVTHMHADAVFHPFVYYCTGDEIDRHYRLEALIDTYFFKHQARWLKRPVSTLDLYMNLKSELDFLAYHITGFLGLSETYIPVLQKALGMHRFVLRLFRSRAGYYLFLLVSMVGTIDFKHKKYLFYPAGMRFETPLFDSEFFYRHPVTGEEQTDSIDSLTEMVIEKTCESFKILSDAAQEKQVTAYFSGIKPISLETGLDDSFSRDFKYIDLSLPIDRLVANKNGLKSGKQG